MKLRFPFLFCFYIAVLFLIAILPINKKDSLANNTYILSFRLDYIYHMLFFLPWMSLSYVFISKKEIDKKKRVIWFWFFIGFILSVGTEGIQYFLTYRAFNINDIMANLSGLVFGWFCIPIFGLIYLKINKSSS